MHNKIAILILIFFSLSAFAQNEVQLEEEKTDKGIVLTAVNSSNQSIQVIVTINSAGFGLKKEEVFSAAIDGNSRKEIVTLVPRPGRQCTYSANLSYTTKKESPTVTQTKITKTTKTTTQQPIASAPAKQSAVKPVEKKNPLTGKKGIVVYSKQGCGRCDYVTKYLRDNNIPFQDLNISTNQAADDEMVEILFANGFKGGSFTTPVITVDDKMHYNIKDLRGFLAELNK